MVREILERKTETHEDYNLANFERELRRRYEILSSASLKRGERRIYYCAPLA
jgi:predicted DNA-binding protein